MRSKVWSAVRTKLGLAAVGVALLATGVGFGAAAVTGSPATEPVSDSSVVTTPAGTPAANAPPSAEPGAPTVEVVTVTPEPTPVHEESQAAVTTPASEPVVEAPSPLVPEPVSPEPVAVEPEPVTPVAPVEQPDPAESSQEYDPTAPFTDAAGNTYVPDAPPPPAKLPGDPGYVPPAG